MRLLGKDLSAKDVLGRIEERLRARGLSPPEPADDVLDEVEARVDPLSFNLDALSEHADATQGLPTETHRDGLAGAAIVFAKRAFRALGQVFINEALARQTVFNGHVRDSYAQLSAEVLRLRDEVSSLHAALESVKTAPPPPPEASPAGAQTKSVEKKSPRRKP